MIPALEGDEIDAITAGMTKDKTREEGADFTTPYYDSKGMIMIVRKDGEEAGYTDIQQFTGKNVVGQKSTNYDDVIDQIKGVNHVTPKATYPEMVLALQQHEVDGITAEMAVAKGVVEANPDLTVVQFADGHGFDCDTTVSIALKEGSRDSEFFKKVQKHWIVLVMKNVKNDGTCSRKPTNRGLIMRIDIAKALEHICS